MHRKSNFTWFYLTVLSAPLIFFHYKILFLGQAVGGGDLINQFVPWREFALSELHRGRFPFWNPYVFCGTPFFANIQTMLFYPFNLLHLFFPVERAFSLSLVIHHLLAGLGMYLFLVQLLRSQPGAVAGAFIYSWSGFFITHAHDGHLIHLQAYAWLPFVLLIQTHWRESITFPRLFLFALLLAAMFFAGHTQIPLYVFYLLLFRSLRWGWEDWRREKNIIKSIRWFGFTLIGILFSLILSAIVLIPLFELSSHTAGRAGGADYSFATNDSLPPTHLVTFLAPFFYGHPNRADRESRFWETPTGYHEICGYAGVLSLILALFAFLPRDAHEEKENRIHSEIRFFGLIAVGALFFSLGRYNPFYILLYYGLPGWKYFRVPGRLVMLFITGLSVCSARGLALWLESRFSQIKNCRAVKIAAGFSVLVLIILVTMYFTQMSWLSFLRQIEIDRSMQAYNLPESQRLAVSLQLPQILFQTRFKWMLGSLAATGVLLMGGWISLGIAMRLQSSYRWLLPVGWLLLDLFLFSSRFISTKPLDLWRKTYYPQTDLITFLQQYAKGSRVLEMDDAIGNPGLDSHPELRPNRLMRYGIESVRGYDPIILNSYTRLINKIYHQPPDAPQGGLLFFPPPEDSSVNYDSLNARFILTTQKLRLPYRLVWEEKKSPVKIYENPDARDRFFWEPQADGDTVEVITSQPSYQELQVRCPQEKILVWSQAYYPGWQIRLDGNAAAIQLYQDAFIAVKIPAGNHRVIFSYYPPNWTLGCTITILALLLSLIYLFVYSRRNYTIPSN